MYNLLEIYVQILSFRRFTVHLLKLRTNQTKAIH